MFAGFVDDGIRHRRLNLWRLTVEVIDPDLDSVHLLGCQGCHLPAGFFGAVGLDDYVTDLLRGMTVRRRETAPRCEQPRGQQLSVTFSFAHVERRLRIRTHAADTGYAEVKIGIQV